MKKKKQNKSTCSFQRHINKKIQQLFCHCQFIIGLMMPKALFLCKFYFVALKCDFLHIQHECCMPLPLSIKAVSSFFWRNAEVCVWNHIEMAQRSDTSVTIKTTDTEELLSVRTLRNSECTVASVCDMHFLDNMFLCL